MLKGSSAKDDKSTHTKRTSNHPAQLPYFEGKPYLKPNMVALVCNSRI